MIVFSGPIPDDKWLQAVQIVKDSVRHSSVPPALG